MKTRTWEYGTELKVEVESASKSAVIVIATEIKEGFILVGHGLNPLPKKGDKGKIVFNKGGVTGGYWQYFAE